MPHPISADHFVIAIFLGLLTLAAYFDAREYRIPNPINLVIAALYPIHVLASENPVDWPGAVMTAAVVFAVGLGVFVFRIMGGGDVKLLAGAALWAGPAEVLPFLMVTALTGGVMALVMLIASTRFGLAMAFDAVGGHALRDMMLNKVLPYAVAIAAGGYYVGWQLMVG